MKSFLSNRPSELKSNTLAEPKAVGPSGLLALTGFQTQPRNCDDDSSGSVVTCRRDGEIVRTIIVNCACGKVTEIDCHYQSDCGSRPNA